MANSLEFWHVGIPVKDLTRSVEFYCGKLDFKLLGYDEQMDKKQAFVLTKSGFTIELFKPTVPGEYQIPDHLAFECSDLASYRRELIESGVQVSEPIEIRKGFTLIWLKDPDGVHIDIAEGRRHYENSLKKEKP